MQGIKPIFGKAGLRCSILNATDFGATPGKMIGNRFTTMGKINPQANCCLLNDVSAVAGLDIGRQKPR